MSGEWNRSVWAVGVLMFLILQFIPIQNCIGILRCIPSLPFPQSHFVLCFSNTSGCSCVGKRLSEDQLLSVCHPSVPRALLWICWAQPEQRLTLYLVTFSNFALFLPFFFSSFFKILVCGVCSSSKFPKNDTCIVCFLCWPRHLLSLKFPWAGEEVGMTSLLLEEAQRRGGNWLMIQTEAAESSCGPNGIPGTTTAVPASIIASLTEPCSSSGLCQLPLSTVNISFQSGTRMELSVCIHLGKEILCQESTVNPVTANTCIWAAAGLRGARHCFADIFQVGHGPRGAKGTAGCTHGAPWCSQSSSVEVPVSFRKSHFFFSSFPVII